MTPFQVIWLAGSVPQKALIDLFDASAELAIAKTDYEIAQMEADRAIDALIRATDKKASAEAAMKLKMITHGVGK